MLGFGLGAWVKGWILGFILRDSVPELLPLVRTSNGTMQGPRGQVPSKLFPLNLRVRIDRDIVLGLWLWDKG